MPVVLIVVGIPALVAGAELLVRGASRIAAAAGISPVVIGLTIVAFGTSAPELAVNINAVFAGEPDVALGNVVGSNIANILLILGIAALVASLPVAARIIRIDVPIMIGTSVLLLLLAIGGEINRLEGLLLMAGLAAYLYLLWRQTRAESAAVRFEFATEFGPSGAAGGRGGRTIARDIVFVLGGFGLLVVGGRTIVDGAVGIATQLGVPDVVVGLTIVAVGTSLPEVATAVVSARRGEPDLAVGNVIGSCIFNVLVVVGLTASIAPEPIPVPPSLLAFDLPVMVAVSLITLPIVFVGFAVRRWEGALLVAYYAAYIAYLVLDAVHRPALEPFSMVMLLFVIPATLLGIGLAVVQQIRSMRREAQADAERAPVESAER